MRFSVPDLPLLADHNYSLLLSQGEVYYSDDIEVHETKNSKIWLINPNSASLNLDEVERIDNEKCNIFDYGSMWASLIKDKETGKFRAISSTNNEFSWYYSDSDSNILSNNIFLLASQIKNIELDYGSIAEFLALNLIVGGYSFIKGIRKSYGGDIIYLGDEKVKVKSIDLTRWLAFDDSINDRKLFVDQFAEIVDKSIENNNTQITLTAGMDSRAVLAGALLTQKKFAVMTGAASGINKNDLIISKKIANLLNLEHVLVNHGKDKGPSIEIMLESAALVTNAEFIPRNWILYYKEYILNKDKIKGLHRILGYGGEVFKGKDREVLSSAKNKITNFNKDPANLVFERVSACYNNYKKLSTRDAKEIYHLREKFQFWEAVNIRAYSNSCKNFCPLSDPNLLAYGFRFKGGIKNVNLHQTLFNTLPNNIQRIKINHSRLVKIISRIKNRKLSRYVDYNYFLTPDYLEKNINADIINNIIDYSYVKKMINQYRLRGVNSDLLHKFLAVSKLGELITKCKENKHSL